jgi:ATP-dependent Lon protease
VPKQVRENGLGPESITFTDDALVELGRHYTREAGVRNLERQIGALCRKQARRIASGARGAFVVTPEVVRADLGPQRHRIETELAQRTRHPGVAVGLAWTPVGGDVLFVEATAMARGRGSLTLTGQLGDVMQESARAAMSYVRSRAIEFGLSPDFYQKLDVHIHIPEGAIPKDGPSAGITMATALVSALVRVPVRHDLAMTGEITLRGQVLPIGGLKEKVFAAHRAGIGTVLVPRENEKDVKDIPPMVLKAVRLQFVEHMDEVLRAALVLSDPESFLQPSSGTAGLPTPVAPVQPNIVTH